MAPHATSTPSTEAECEAGRRVGPTKCMYNPSPRHRTPGRARVWSLQPAGPRISRVEKTFKTNVRAPRDSIPRPMQLWCQPGWTIKTY